MADMMNQVQELFKLHLELEAKVQKEKERVNCDFFWGGLFVLICTLLIGITFADMRHQIDKLNFRIPSSTHQKAPEPPKPAATTTTTPTRVMRQLHFNDVLNEGDLLQSENGEYELVLQQDANLVLYRGKQRTPQDAVWSSDSIDKNAVHPLSVHFTPGGHGIFIQEADGNTVWRWTTPTDKNGPAALKICHGRLMFFPISRDGEYVLCPLHAVAFVE
jgi:hypothetical protein